MTAVEDLARWLGEQYDEEQRVAEAATPGPWWYNPGKQWLGPEAFEEYDLRQGEEFVGYGGPHPFTGAVAATGPANNDQSMRDAEFIAEHDPARVLREIDSKRAIVDDLAEFIRWGARKGVDYQDGVDACERTLKRLALPYADRPGYREEWRP